MSPHAVVIADIGFKDATKVGFAEHNNMIKAFPADGTDQPLRIRYRLISNADRYNLPPVTAKDHQSIQQSKADGWHDQKSLR